MQFNEVIVVEGIHDEMKIREVLPQANVIITNGREISNDTLLMIKEISEKKDIILFLDPDSPGEKIRSLITNLVPNAKHAFIEKKKCISNNRKKVGIEHASGEDVLDALNNLLTPCQKESDITMGMLYSLGVIGQTDSAKKREYLSEVFHIGHPNAKTFLRRLEMFGIQYQQLAKALEEGDTK